MRLLALDLGTACGWAYFEDGVRRGSGTWHLGKDRYKSRGELFLMLVLSFVQSHKVDIIVHEHVPALHGHTSADAAHLFGGWLMQLETVARRTNVKVTRLDPETIRQRAGIKLDRRRAPKDAGKETRRRLAEVRRENNKKAVIEAARARGWIAGDDNEADALITGAVVLEGAGT